MGIDGTYNIIADTPMGKMEITLTLKTDGDSLSGSTSSAMMGTAEFSGGKIDGDSFEFTMGMNSPIGKIEMTNSGIVDGDNISGVVKTSMGNSTYTGTRG